MKRKKGRDKRKGERMLQGIEKLGLIGKGTEREKHDWKKREQRK